MRNSLLFLWLCLMASLSTLGQTRPDQIFLLDKTTQNAFVDEIGETAITYFLPTDTNRQSPMQILKSRIWKIVFANGEVELINPLPPDPIQPARNLAYDRIYSTDKTILEGTIIKIGETVVEYKRSGADANDPVYEYPLQKVEKIELANGEVKTFEAHALSKSGKKADESQKPKSAPKEKQEVAKKEPKPESTKLEKVEIPGEPTLNSKFGLSIGFVVSYVIKGADQQADTNRVGFRHGLGEALILQYKVSKWLALSFHGGYNLFLANHAYLTSVGDTLYTAKYSFISIPLQLGIKVYPVKSVYLGMYGGMNYLLTKFIINSDNGLETKRFSPSGTAAIGFEPRIGKLKLDIAVQYTYSTITATSKYTSSPAIQTPQFKIGFGF